MADGPADPERLLEDEGCYVALTNASLSAQSIMDRVRSPSAGAIVLFAGERLLFAIVSLAQ